MDAPPERSCGRGRKQKRNYSGERRSHLSLPLKKRKSKTF